MQSSLKNNMNSSNRKINVNLEKRTSSGRKRIEMKKINNVSSRQVTFSKRRMGIFKKATELCILTGAEIAIIVHSSGNHVFSFGHPNAESVISRYITGVPVANRGSSSSYGTADNALQYKQQYNRVKNELEAEIKKKDIAKTEGNFNWWNEPIEDLGEEELEKYMAALQELKNNVIMKADLLKNNDVIVKPDQESNSCNIFGDLQHVDYADHQYYPLQPNGSFEFGNGQISGCGGSGGGEFSSMLSAAEFGNGQIYGGGEFSSLLSYCSELGKGRIYGDGELSSMLSYGGSEFRKGHIYGGGGDCSGMLPYGGFEFGIKGENYGDGECSGMLPYDSEFGKGHIYGGGGGGGECSSIFN